MEQQKVREARLRRAAARQGLRLQKSRRRDPRARDYGRYWLTDVYTNRGVAGDMDGCTLDEIERVLNRKASP
jgi:hypothetical protein